MTYLNRIAGKEFMDTFDRAVRLKEGIRRQSDKLDRAIRRNTGDAAKAARALQGLQSSYKAAEAELAALARVHKLEIDVREALAGVFFTNLGLVFLKIRLFFFKHSPLPLKR